MATPLYVSDLDGTLLRPDGTLSDYSRDELNRLIADGLHFTVATARSVASMRRLLPGLQLQLPVININGALLSDIHSGHHQAMQGLAPTTAATVYDRIEALGLRPFISTCSSERDALYYAAIDNPGMQWYVDDRLRANDERLTRTDDLQATLAESVIAFTVIDHQPALLKELRTSLEQQCPGEVQTYIFPNSYSDLGDYWLSVCDARATKDRGIRLLIERGGYRIEDLTVFGDSDNDVEMFKMAPRAIATANAIQQIRALATEIIGPNSEDSVVRYLAAQMQ